MSFNKYWVAQFVFRLSCQDSLWPTKLFFQQLYLQSTVRRDFLPLGDLQTWKVMTALILGFPANLLLLLTGDVTPIQTMAWWNHRRYEERQISHTRWHTRLSATSGHLLEDLLPDLLHLANQNSAGCYLITHFIVSHHPRLHWPFHFFSLGIFLLLIFKNLSFSIIKPTHVYLPHQVFPHYSIMVQAGRESWHWWLWSPVCVLSGQTAVLRS